MPQTILYLAKKKKSVTLSQERRYLLILLLKLPGAQTVHLVFTKLRDYPQASLQCSCHPFPSRHLLCHSPLGSEEAILKTKTVELRNGKIFAYSLRSFLIFPQPLKHGFNRPVKWGLGVPHGKRGSSGAPSHPPHPPAEGAEPTRHAPFRGGRRETPACGRAEQQQPHQQPHQQRAWPGGSFPMGPSHSECRERAERTDRGGRRPRRRKSGVPIKGLFCSGLRSRLCTLLSWDREKLLLEPGALDQSIHPRGSGD